MAVVLGLSAFAAQADGLFSYRNLGTAKALNADLSFRSLAENPATASLEVVNANAAAVNRNASSLEFNLAPGLNLKAHQVSSYKMDSGSLVWAGVIEDPGTISTSTDFQFDAVNSVMLVRDGDQITGNVHFDGQWYQIRPLRSGGHAIVAVDQSRMPADHPAEYASLPTIKMPIKPNMAQAKANTTIRVMVHYDGAASAASGNISSLIDLAVAESNQGYTNSGVQITLQLATKAAVTYTESGSFSTDLSRYRGTADGYMDSIHTTRNTVTADVGVLLINNTSACGLASSIGASASTAFVAVYWGCATGYYSFAHEIGHLQSARHDPATDPTNSPYAYGHGYRYTGSPSWRTIMAYDCPAGCPRLNYWSSPLKTYNSQPMGTAAGNDNARVLNNTRATVAAFR
ncbi:MAG TPA: M12 family metallo-peptidase [Thermoanaerobaculia bacterium]|jgi:hypothetical protein|nr:M12 family metallo-peptidase [Thermoanaerobaculia bacterium]